MILTIGHSKHPLPAFLGLLQRHEVQCLADVRRNPYSRREPQFNRESLAAALAAAGLHYQHMEALGGRRTQLQASPNSGLGDPALRGFADHMGTPEFRAALDVLVKRSHDQKAAIMCAEGSPERCHRWLIADALVARGVVVEHILDGGQRTPHRLSVDARVEGGSVRYPAAQIRLDFEAD